MPQRFFLSPTSYVVLGIVAELGEVTPYEMKRFVARSIGYFWSFPHSQLYAEPARLAVAGLLSEHVETSGRRRKTYSITPMGRELLERWLARSSDEPTELRDLGLLKLFFGAQTGPAQRRALAEEQVRNHTQRRKEYEDLREEVKEVATPYQLATLEMGLRYERAMIAFWREQLKDDEEVSQAEPRR